MIKMILVNNEIIPREGYRPDIEDRAYQFGDGIYEVIRIYRGFAFRLEGHIDRLWKSAAGLGLNLPFTKESLGENLFNLVKANGLDDGIIYLQVSRGAAPRVHHVPENIQPVLVAYTRPRGRPLSLSDEGARAVTFEDVRWQNCHLKTLNLLGNVLAKQAAVERGATEAIFHRGGRVTEGSSSNIFMVSGDEIFTHPLNNLILGGITREVVVQLAGRLKINLRQEAFTVGRMCAAEEVFATSTTYEIMPVTEIDGVAVGPGVPGPVTRLIQSGFEEEVAACGRGIPLIKRPAVQPAN